MEDPLFDIQINDDLMIVVLVLSIIFGWMYLQKWLGH